MNISQSGRVVVIDDNKKEAYPLIETLSKKGIPSTYFSSEIEQLPDKPLSGIRIVFLDIESEQLVNQMKQKFLPRLEY